MPLWGIFGGGGGGDGDAEKNTDRSDGQDGAAIKGSPALAAGPGPSKGAVDTPKMAEPPLHVAEASSNRGVGSPSDGAAKDGAPQAAWTLGGVLAGAQANSTMPQNIATKQQSRADDDGSNGDMARANSTGSGTASTKSISSDSASNSPDSDSAAKAVLNVVQQQKQQKALSPNGSPTDDDQTIARLDNECIRLSLEMSRIKKYTHQWFALETRLNNAKDELDAAKEDRDLHFYVGGGASPIEVVSPTLDESDNQRQGEVDDGAIGAASVNGNVRAEVPETVFFGETKGGHAAKEKVKGKRVWPSQMNTASLAPGTAVSEDPRIRLEYERKQEELKTLPKFSDEWFELKDELVQMSISLDEGPVTIPHPVATLLGKSLADAPRNRRRAPPQDTPREIEVVSRPSIKQREPDRLFSQSKDEAKGTDKRKDKATKKRNKEKAAKRGRKHHPSSPQIRRISPERLTRSPRSPSPMPVGGRLSPYPTSSSSGDVASTQCLSPYHSTSPLASHRGNAPQNIYQMAIDGRSVEDEDPNSQEYQMSIAIEDLLQKRDQAVKEIERATTYSPEWFELKTTINELEDRIEELENDSSDGSTAYLKNQSMVSGWSSVRSESEEELLSMASDLDYAMVAAALKQQHEFEDGELIVETEKQTNFDKAEAEMLSTSLKDEDEPDMRQVEVDHLKIIHSVVRIQAFVRGWMQLREYGRQRARAQYAVIAQSSTAATVIQTFVRKERAKARFRWTLLAIVRMQCFLRCCGAKKTVGAARAEKVRQDRIAKERDAKIKAESSEFDTMLDGLAIMIGDQTDEEAEVHAFNAMMIEASWCAYIACRPVIGLRKKAQAYRVLKRDEALLHNRFKIFSALDRGDKQQEEKEERVTWDKFAVVYVQAVWRKCLARRQFLLQRSSAAKIQALVRGRLISRQLAEQREKAIVIQSFVRQKQAMSKLKRAGLATTVIQRLWRKALSGMPWKFVRKHASKLQALVRAQQQQRRYHRKQEKSVVIQTFLRTIWVATGQLYTDQRTATFYATDLGIDLHRGKDGFVRVLSTALYESTASVISSLVPDGTIEPGDLVLKAAGVNLKSPITSEGFEDTVQKIRDRPRPMMLLVASGTRRIKNQLADECRSVSLELQSVVSAVKIQRLWRGSWVAVKSRADKIRASLTIQACARKWLARCLDERKLERDELLAEFEATMLQLKRLQAATLLQSHARKWKVRASISQQQDAAIRIQAVARMSASRMKYWQTVVNVIRLQMFAQSWLSARRQAATVLQARTRGSISRLYFAWHRESCVCIQALARMIVQRRRYKRALSNIVVVQSLVRLRVAYADLSRKLWASMRIQAFIRMNSERRKYNQLMMRVDLLQIVAKIWLSERRDAATVLQTRAREVAARTSFLRQREASIRIQTVARKNAAKEEYAQLQKSVALINSSIYKWWILRNYAAVVVQSLVRRYLVRKKPRKKPLTRFELLRLRAEQQSSGARPGPVARGRQPRGRAKPKPIRNYALLRKEMERAELERAKQLERAELERIEQLERDEQERMEQLERTEQERQRSENDASAHVVDEAAQELDDRTATPVAGIEQAAQKQAALELAARERREQAARERAEQAARERRAEAGRLRKQLEQQAAKKRQAQAAIASSDAPKAPGRFELMMRRKMEHAEQGRQDSRTAPTNVPQKQVPSTNQVLSPERATQQPQSKPPGRFERMMSKKAANEPQLGVPTAAPTTVSRKKTAYRQQTQSKAKAPPPTVSKPQAKPPGRFERLLRKKRSAKEPPSAAVAAPRQQVQPTNKPPSPATQPPGRFESLMQKQLSANEPPSAAPSRQQDLPTNKPSSPEGAAQLPQARSPGRFESLMQKQLSTKEPPSSSVTAAPLPPASPPSPPEGVHRSTGRFESLMQQQLSTKEPPRSAPPNDVPPASPREGLSSSKPSPIDGAKPLPQARPPGKFELLMQQQREKSESKPSPQKSDSEAKSSTPPVHSEPRGWDPEKEIDTDRVDSIKAMWGAKAAGSQPRLPTGSSRKF